MADERKCYAGDLGSDALGKTVVVPRSGLDEGYVGILTMVSHFMGVTGKPVAELRFAPTVSNGESRVLTVDDGVAVEVLRRPSVHEGRCGVFGPTHRGLLKGDRNAGSGGERQEPAAEGANRDGAFDGLDVAAVDGVVNGDRRAGVVELLGHGASSLSGCPSTVPGGCDTASGGDAA